MKLRTFTPIVVIAFPVLLVALACTESPSSPLARVVPSSSATITSAVTCERSWTSATSGAWTDSTRWTPAKIPDYRDVVCFAAAGTYTVTGIGIARLLYLTNGAEVTFVNTAGLGAVVSAYTLTMQSTSRLVVAGCTQLQVEHAVVDGTLHLETDPSACPASELRPHRFIHLENNGVLELDSAVIEPMTYLSYLDFVNRGIVNVQQESSIDLVEGSAWLHAGTIFGTGRLSLTGDKSYGSVVWWRGTRLPPRSTPTSLALLFVRAPYLSLLDSTTFGAIDTSVGEMDGDIGSGMDVTFLGPTTYLPHGTVNNGTITLLSNWVTTITASWGITNNGAIRALSGTPFQVLHAHIQNHGTIDVTGTLTLPPVSELANAGSIVVRPGALLRLDGAELEQQPSGTTSGAIEALGATARVVGSGHISSLRLDSAATLSPGTVWTEIGSLSFDTLSIGPGAVSEIELTDPADSPGDRVHVVRSLTLGGTLRLATDSTYTGGICGQVATPFTMAKTATVTGSFSAITGTQLDAARAWRLVPGTTTMRVAGYNPGIRMSVAPNAVAVAEGGSAATVNACLGTQAPSANVSVIPTARFGQVGVLPAPISFTTSNWALPQPFTVTAIDDARAEGPHVDSVSFTLSSADPGYRGMVQPQLHVDVTDNDPAVDLALSLVSAPATAVVGGLADLRFRVTNAGPGNSTGSTFTLKPMAGLTLESNSAAVTCTQGSGVLTCTVGAVASGTSLDFLLLLRATAAGTQTNTARLLGRDYDPALGDNAVAWVITIS